MYIRVKQIVENKTMQGGMWFNPRGVDWMEADLNENMLLIVGSPFFHRNIEVFF